ncbi:hypothetical protein A2331_04805 [Candidatus Falkowbacteria bacterium RIFOXYB2_FULL_34_18]|uniref:Uncharacterized protein n=1 Tax=Candidatus Falkowbacteria bacterium RIFOXYD2_FULL_34_120 TaxID=1798007 RepID=A0A1F5TPR5_9BACT|nr:MAG: hypothetical protein A2331_04805 [Candidatus Falkowbacteria bacterium RIFOXYB2_FULL_34_18]OGF28860.1 MAG: hypothetical protein A2500_00570 [Candidatus Falkowbacteria bacterium RIFOXYC12_FULL_34_55]OGF35767.1 MAG: hypothetical protein A2466_04500 [Candidatus Falkowbacteria bacterium RIFOXYC2_FULL_34_220]OGF38433.1 MAG: hypothetical protein A2515_01940 [Candidatus Falkowbacteria bacterium RIFOXYD12_FULL_34_57]OGF40511.1 MAG: hypothetical protein A2531_02985 [Candidatus Falkowbacteria bact
MYKFFYSDEVFKERSTLFLSTPYISTFWANPDFVSLIPAKKRFFNTEEQIRENERYNRELKKLYHQHPALRICFNVGGLCREAFDKNTSFCEDVYKFFKILEKNGRLQNRATVLHSIYSLRDNKHVGTLAYNLRANSIRNTYHGLRIDDNAHELMHFAIDPFLAPRIEVLPERLVNMRADDSPANWKKKMGNFYCRKINSQKEVGKMLFDGMLKFYSNLVKDTPYKQPPQLVISTHRIIIDFFTKVTGINFFQELPKDGINWDGIPKVSHVAFQSLDFRPYEIKLWELLPDLFPEKAKEVVRAEEERKDSVKKFKKNNFPWPFLPIPLTESFAATPV